MRERRRQKQEERRREESGTLTLTHKHEAKWLSHLFSLALVSIAVSMATSESGSPTVQ